MGIQDRLTQAIAGLAPLRRGSLPRLTAWRMAAYAAAAVCGLSSTLLFAQTNVGGAIGVDTIWATNNGPYIVTSDVTIQSGATLTIEAGATIYMAAGTSLTVSSGKVLALGTSLAPITVSSDAVRMGQAGAPGQWNNWTFNAGDLSTKLEQVTFKFGKGLRIYGAAPVLNYVRVESHDGSAIAIDLAASPTGVGNSASGCTANAVVVPPGDVTGTVTWGLRGIPYLVQTGTVSVGTSPDIASVTPTSIQQGETVPITLGGTRLGNPSRVTFSSSGLTAQILGTSTTTNTRLSVTAAVDATLGPTDVNLLVEAGEVREVAAFTVTRPQPKLTSIVPTTIYINQGNTPIELNGANFNVDALALVNNVQVAVEYVSSTKLIATVPNQTAPATLPVKVQVPDPDNAGQFFSSAEKTLTVTTPALAIAPGAETVDRTFTKNLTLTIPFAAPASGLTVNVVSTVPSVATVPTTVTVAEGQTTVVVPVTGVSIGSTAISVSKTGFTSAESQVAVVQEPTLTTAPATLAVGAGRTPSLTITSNRIAGAEGLVVSLSSSNTDVATVPPSVTILAGQSAVTTTVTTVALGTATVTVQTGGFVTGVATVNVQPLSLLLPATSIVAPGLSRSVVLNLTDPAPAGGLEVALTSSDPAVFTVPATITVVEGASAANITLLGVATGGGTLSATASGYEPDTMPIAVKQVIVGLGAASISVPETVTTAAYGVTLSDPAPAGGLSVALSLDDPGLASFSNASVFVPEGQTSGVVKYQLTGVASGSTTLRASAAGLAPVAVPVTVTGQPYLKILQAAGGTSGIVGTGMKSHLSEFYVARFTDEGLYNGPEALTVTLTSSDTAKLSAPTTVTVAAGQSSANFQLSGLDSTSGTPVLVDAGAAGYIAPTAKLAVEVNTPYLAIENLDANRALASARDDITLRVSIAGTSFGGGGLVAPMTVGLEIVEANPSGIVTAFYPIGGCCLGPITSATISTSGATTVYVGQPTSIGTYKVKVTATIGSVTSAAVNVIAPTLKAMTINGLSSDVVSKGMRTSGSTGSGRFEVRRFIGDNYYVSVEEPVVSFTSSDSLKAIGYGVVIGPNSVNKAFQVEGRELTDASPVTLTPTATGYVSDPTPLSLTVIPPTLTLPSLDPARGLTSARDNFTVRFNGSPSTTLTNTVPVTLEVVDADPPGIVSGIYSAATGGSPITSVSVFAGSIVSSTVYADVPTATGTYKIRATSSLGSVTSDPVIVTGPTLKVLRTTGGTSGVVGKGFKSASSEFTVQRFVNDVPFLGTSAVTVTLTSSDPLKLTVPATAIIPANASSVTFQVSGLELTEGVPALVDATATDYASPATKLSVDVIPPVFAINSLDTTRGPTSARDSFTVSATVPGTTSNGTAISSIPLTLEVVEASPAGIIDGFYSASTGTTTVTQVTIAAASSSSSTAFVGAPTVTGSYKIKATSSLGSAISNLVNVVVPSLAVLPFSGSDSPAVLGKAMRRSFVVRRFIGGANYSGTEALTVNLACSSTAVCSVQPTVTIAANSNSANVNITGTGVGTTTVTATAVGYSSPAQDLGISTVLPQLSFSGGSTPRVGTQGSFSVALSVPGGSGSVAASAITVNLTSSAPDVATVPATTTIASGSAQSPSVSYPGLSAGTTTLTASGVDMQPGTRTVTVIP